jgi:hypothetical protein
MDEKTGKMKQCKDQDKSTTAHGFLRAQKLRQPVAVIAGEI